jgi:hypothetical protein
MEDALLSSDLISKCKQAKNDYLCMSSALIALGLHSYSLTSSRMVTRGPCAKR